MDLATIIGFYTEGPHSLSTPPLSPVRHPLGFPMGVSLEQEEAPLVEGALLPCRFLLQGVIALIARKSWHHFFNTAP